MDVLLALILACSVHPDDHLVEALASTMSHANQYFVGDLSTLDTFENAHTVAEAHTIIEEILSRGGRPAVGYLAVPVSWAARFRRTPDDLLEGCVNVGVATAMLSEYAQLCTVGPTRRHRHRRSHQRHRPYTTPRMRSCILRRLEIDLDITGVVEHVLPEVARLEGRPRDRDEDPVDARAPLYPDDTDDAHLHETTDWSNPRLYFAPSPAAPQASAGGRASTSASRSTPAHDRSVPHP